jgi:hypothetical protein
MRSHDPGMVSLMASHGAIRLGRSLALAFRKFGVDLPDLPCPSRQFLR